jgi:hypothetical protein
MTKRLIAVLLAVCGAAAMAQSEWDYGIGQKDQVTKGLVAYWAMRNSGTTVYDEFGSYNGTATGGVTFAYASGTVGSGGSFNGSDGDITIADNAAFTPTVGLTVSAWVKAAAQTTKAIIAHYSTTPTAQRSWFVGSGTINNTKLQCIISDNGTYTSHVKTYESSITVFDDTWRHVVLTFACATKIMTLYVDGTADASPNKVQDADISSIHNSTAPVTVGSYATRTAFFAGLADEIRIFNVALTSDEVKQLYRMGATPRGIK